MPKCKRCGTEFATRSGLQSHERRKTPCESRDSNSGNDSSSSSDSSSDSDSDSESDSSSSSDSDDKRESKTANTEVDELTRRAARVEIESRHANTANDNRRANAPRRSNRMGTFLKWVGGKTQILDQVMLLFPKEIKNYYEPFLGGGSVLLELLARDAAGSITIRGSVYASDVNPDLINVYRQIQRCVDDVIRELERIAADFTVAAAADEGDVDRDPDMAVMPRNAETFYYWMRKRYNAPTDNNDRDTARRAAEFIFLNKTCFRGMYRVSRRGGFNVPYGNYSKPAIYDTKQLRYVSRLTQRVEFRTCTYRDALAAVESGDFVYLDPPYAPANSRSFVAYTSGGFDSDEHDALFRTLHELDRKKVRVVMSNADVPLVREALAAAAEPWYVQDFWARRSINSRRPDAIAGEILATNRATLLRD